MGICLIVSDYGTGTGPGGRVEGMVGEMGKWGGGRGVPADISRI